MQRNNPTDTPISQRSKCTSVLKNTNFHYTLQKVYHNFWHHGWYITAPRKHIISISRTSNNNCGRIRSHTCKHSVCACPHFVSRSAAHFLEPDSELLTLSESLDPKMSKMQNGRKTENQIIGTSMKTLNLRRLGKLGTPETTKIQETSKSGKS